MNDLISLEKIAQWQKLKTLVLDNSFPRRLTKRVYSNRNDITSAPDRGESGRGNRGDKLIVC
jgi:hypothetical protein